jgi:hypothetical protein
LESTRSAAQAEMAGHRPALSENAPGAAGARPAADGRLGEPDTGPAPGRS